VIVLENVPIVVETSADLLSKMDTFMLVPHTIPLSVSVLLPLSVTFPEIVAEKAETAVPATVGTVGILVLVV
jgi:hypothetical protein